MATMWAAKGGSSLRATVERSAAGSGLDGNATSKILAAMRRLAPSGSVREDAFLLVLQELGVTGVAARRLFRRFDAPPRGKGSGTVSVETLIEGLGVLRRGGDDALRLVFECWDSDGDGRITLDELGSIVLGFASGAQQQRRAPRARRRAAGAALGKSRSSSVDSIDGSASGASDRAARPRLPSSEAEAEPRLGLSAQDTRQGTPSTAASGGDVASASFREVSHSRPPVAPARAATHSGARAADVRPASFGEGGGATAEAAAGSAARAARAVGLWSEAAQCGPTDLVSRFPTADVAHLDMDMAVPPSELARSRVLASAAAGRRLRQAQSAELELALEGAAAMAGAAAAAGGEDDDATPLKAASLTFLPAGVAIPGRPGSPSAQRAPTHSPFHGLARLGDASDALPPHRDGAEPLQPPQATLSRTDTEAEWVAARAVVRERLGGASLIRERPLEPASTPLAAGREAGRQQFDMPPSPASASANAAACASPSPGGSGGQEDEDFVAATGLLSGDEDDPGTEDSETSDRSSLAHGPPAPGEEFRVRRRRRRRPSLNIIASSKGDEQAGHLRDLFSAIDVNQDGTIEFSEFKEAIRSHPCLVEAFLRPMDGLGGSFHQWLLDLHS